MPKSSDTFAQAPRKGGVRGEEYDYRVDLAMSVFEVLFRSGRAASPVGSLQLATRIGHDKATPALANELARYAWAVATHDRGFETTPARAA